LGKDDHQKLSVTLKNFSKQAATFSLSLKDDAGSPHSLGFPSSVTVPKNGEKHVNVTLDVPAATAGHSSAFHDVSGLLRFTPASSGDNAGVTLDVPYYLVPQALSTISTSIDAKALAKVGAAIGTVTNKKGVITGTADWYAWGLSDGRDHGLGSNDLQAVGVQAFPGVIAIGISTYQRWSNAAEDEFDVYLDVNRDGTDDYDVVGVDLGAITTGTANGQMAVAVFDLRTGSGSIQFLADAPFNSTTIVLPVLISQLCASGSPCLSSGNPRFDYHAVAFGLTDGSVDTADGPATFNAFNPAISTGMFDVVSPNGSANETVTLNKAEWAQSPALGLIVISHDNASDSEAQLIKVKVK
jgi:hypothetical protein